MRVEMTKASAPLAFDATTGMASTFAWRRGSLTYEAELGASGYPSTAFADAYAPPALEDLPPNLVGAQPLANRCSTAAIWPPGRFG